MKIQISFKVKGGKPVFSESTMKYFQIHDEQEIVGTLQPNAELSPKLKMYSYLHCTILSCAVLGYERHGEIVDEVVAKWKLKAEFLKTHYIDKEGKTHVRVKDLEELTAAELHRFITAAIQYIENELETEVPESKQYIEMKVRERNRK